VERLMDRIRADGRVIGKDILKIDSFLNHQVDVDLMEVIGEEFARYFRRKEITKVLTVEASGIAPAIFTARALRKPLLYARKSKPSTMDAGHYAAEVQSFTKGRVFDITVSASFLGPSDKVLIIDDFLAFGSTVRGLLEITSRAGAEVVGVGIVVEKGFQEAGRQLREQGIDLCSLVVIDRMSEGSVEMHGGIPAASAGHPRR